MCCENKYYSRIKHRVFIIYVRVIIVHLTPLILPKPAKKSEPEEEQGCVSSVHHIKK